MEDGILPIILSSALVGAVVNNTFDIIKKWLDGNADRKKRLYEANKQYLQNKENAYLIAIDRLTSIRTGFAHTREQLTGDAELYKKFQEQEKTFMDEVAKIRLYSSDEIYNLYYLLAQYKEYSYIPPNKIPLDIQQRHLFDIQVAHLSRLMQKDLGFRDFSDNGKDLVTCPSCGTVHDPYYDCPKCGMARKDCVAAYQNMPQKMKEFLYKNANG